MRLIRSGGADGTWVITLLSFGGKIKEEKRVPLGLFDLGAKGNLIHLESQLKSTLPYYLTVNLSCF